jgi:hypothetical protein
MHTICSENAPRIWDWIKNRGGIAIWRSVNLCDPGRTWTTPVLDDKGDLVHKPTWQADNEPIEIICDPEKVLVSRDQEVKRFKVAVRRGSQGFMLKCTDASSAHIRKSVSQAGNGAYHVFDYFTQEAIIMAPVDTFDLNVWYHHFSQEGKDGDHK